MFSSVSTLAKLAMEREPDELYDPVSSSTTAGCFSAGYDEADHRTCGRAGGERAMSCNPLAGCPATGTFRTGSRKRGRGNRVR